MASGTFQLLGMRLAQHLSRPRPHAQTGMPTEQHLLAQCLRPGDVLLVDGSSRVSGAIKYLTQSTWSHAAFYVGSQLGGSDAQGQPYQLIEADMVQGVCKRPLSHYQSYQTRICRPSALGAADLQQLIKGITSKLGPVRSEKRLVSGTLPSAHAASAHPLAPAADCAGQR